MSIEMGHMPKWYLHLTQGVSKPTPACRAKSGNVIAHQQFVKPRWIETFCVDSFAWQAPGSAAGPIFHLNICFFLLHPYNHNFLSQTDSILIVWHLFTKMALLETKIAVLEQKDLFCTVGWQFFWALQSSIYPRLSAQRWNTKHVYLHMNYNDGYLCIVYCKALLLFSIPRLYSQNPL